jgi:hypothetical protein
VGRGHDAHVDFGRLRSAEALELAILQKPEELGLERQRQLANLVQKKGAALGELDAPGLARDGPSKRAFLVPEQLTFQQRLGQRRAIDLDEGLSGSGALLVNCACHELLAGAAFAAHEHQRAAGGCAVEQRHRFGHGGRASGDEPRGNLRGRGLFDAARRDLECLLQHEQDFVPVVGLLHEIGGAAPHRRDHICGRCPEARDDDCRAREALDHRLQDFARANVR